MVPPRLRRRPRHSTVVAYLALFVALGGVSYAALEIPEKSVGNKQLKKDAVTSKKVKNGSLLAKDFDEDELPRGPRGAQGPPGAAGQPGGAGQPGTPGAPGSPAASMLMGFVPANLTSEDVGEGNGYAASGTAGSSAQTIAPNATVVLQDLFVRVSPPATGGARTFTLGDGTDSSPPTPAISCTIMSGQSTCNTGSQTATISPGRIVEFHVDNVGPGNSSDVSVSFGYRATTP